MEFGSNQNISKVLYKSYELYPSPANLDVEFRINYLIENQLWKFLEAFWMYGSMAAWMPRERPRNMKKKNHVLFGCEPLFSWNFRTLTLFEKFIHNISIWDYVNVPGEIVFMQTSLYIVNISTLWEWIRSASMNVIKSSF